MVGHACRRRGSPGGLAIGDRHRDLRDRGRGHARAPAADDGQLVADRHDRRPRNGRPRRLSRRERPARTRRARRRGRRRWPLRQDVPGPSARAGSARTRSTRSTTSSPRDSGGDPAAQPARARRLHPPRPVRRPRPDVRPDLAAGARQRSARAPELPHAATSTSTRSTAQVPPTSRILYEFDTPFERVKLLIGKSPGATHGDDDRRPPAQRAGTRAHR